MKKRWKYALILVAVSAVLIAALYLYNTGTFVLLPNGAYLNISRLGDFKMNIFDVAQGRMEIVFVPFPPEKIGGVEAIREKFEGEKVEVIRFLIDRKNVWQLEVKELATGERYWLSRYSGAQYWDWYVNDQGVQEFHCSFITSGIPEAKERFGTLDGTLRIVEDWPGSTMLVVEANYQPDRPLDMRVEREYQRYLDAHELDYTEDQVLSPITASPARKLEWLCEYRWKEDRWLSVSTLCDNDPSNDQMFDPQIEAREVKTPLDHYLWIRWNERIYTYHQVYPIKDFYHTEIVEEKPGFKLVYRNIGYEEMLCSVFETTRGRVKAWYDWVEIEQH